MEVDDRTSKPDLQKDTSQGGVHPKKSNKLDTKEVQAKEKATSTSEAMDTSYMPELISNDDKEEQSKRKKFTTKNLPASKNQRLCHNPTIYCKVQPRYASLGYPFHNMAAHM